MKTVVIICLLLIAVSAYKGLTPRSDQSCQDIENSVYGWFWDGQKCETCATNKCLCYKYNECINCESKYTIVNGAKGPVCKPCAQSTSTYLSQVYGIGDITTECCSPFDDQGTWQDGWESGLRATDCTPSDDKNTYTLLGSVCHYLEGCESYNLFGKCYTCFAGYYLNEKGLCSKCQSINGDNGNTDYNCAQCSGPDQCDVCKDGFYLESTKVVKVGQTEFDTVAVKSPSFCKPCSAGCKCNDKTNLATAVISNNYFYDNSNVNEPKCTLCSININGCSTCQSKDASTLVQCLTCQAGWALSTTTTNGVSQTICVKCPDNCNSCTVWAGASNVAYCNQNGCNNGFRPRKADSGVGYDCVPCTNNVARCTTDNLGNEVPTQCGKGTDTSIVGIHGQPPHFKEFYLFNKQACVENINNCKTIINTAGKCGECYTDLGYILSSDGKCLKCPTDLPVDLQTGCSTCTANAAGALECTACMNNNNSTMYNDKSKQNFQLDTATKKCTQCVEGCMNCDSKGKCVANGCQAGYFFSNGNCVICPTNNCKKCDNQGVCTQCFDHYRLWATANNNQLVCEACDANCLSCQGNRKACTACAPGFYLLQDTCQARRANCVIMNGKDCTHCNYGYRLVDGRCMRCFDMEGGYVHCPIGCYPESPTFSNINDQTTIGNSTKLF